MDGERGSDSVDIDPQQRPSQAVIEAIVEKEGVSKQELIPPEYEPLHAVIDPDALDALFAEQAPNRPRGDGTVSFTYCGYTVTVDWGEQVTIEDEG